ncbi:MAG TPA: hypothetical protein VKS21_05325, partial [Spirochaetota bacterium]|nr:hypothetical protein [Spirochaetota bacterium]
NLHLLKSAGVRDYKEKLLFIRGSGGQNPRKSRQAAGDKRWPKITYARGREYHFVTQAGCKGNMKAGFLYKGKC